MSFLQNIINSAWRIEGPVPVVGRESYFYVLHFEYMEDIKNICEEGPWSVEKAFFILEK